MAITGENFIGYKRSAKGEINFQAFSPAANSFLSEKFTYATEQEFELALSLAGKAFLSYRKLSAAGRAEFLDTIAEEIGELGDELIERASAESGLPAGRILNERERTRNQLKMFARLLRDGWWADARIDTAQPDRIPLPRSDIRRILIPVGPVAVYGASNFPLAFSTAGGDTASALAAGCPVIVKAHSSHPGTNELVASAIIKAANKTGMPEGVFSSLNLLHEDSLRLAGHPVIKAVGFTGSRKVGMMLFNIAVSRAEPIPVYAEMSAINPVIIMEGALSANSEKIAKDLAGSVTLGVGQFCTNPGLILLIESEASAVFLEQFAQQLSLSNPGTMLNKNICKAYTMGVETVKNLEGVKVLAGSKGQANPERNEALPVAFIVSVEMFLANKQLSEEIFGPATLVVLSKDIGQLIQVLHALEGQLTASVHATPADEKNILIVIDIISEKVGRIIYNGFPTGVEVCHAMQHGGPFPATTNGNATSVGTAAIYRFLRPITFQDTPDHLLPEALKESNPLNIMRLVNGNWTYDKNP